eukprot:PhM_4_TR14203/c0_g1_i2/m.70144/K00485/FMO; dimethylaniline monooxygenase (N-oxide forming)
MLRRTSLNSRFSVAVIGAGSSGLVTMKALRSAGAMVTAFEQQAMVGGRWNYQDDAMGNRGYRSNVYQSMTCNVPKDVLAFSDHRFSFFMPQKVHHTNVAHYLQDYAEKKSLLTFCRMNTKVESVLWDTERSRWVLTSVNVLTGEVYEWIFDSVVVASGMMRYEHRPAAFLPTNPTLLNFRGTVLHSLSYKRPRGYANTRVLVIGSGPASFEIGMEVYEAGASEVVHCLRPDAALRVYFKQNKVYNTRRGITKYLFSEVSGFDENGRDIIFEDGTVLKDVDHVILATGHDLKMPFLPEDVESDIISRDDPTHTRNLIHDILYAHNPTLAVVGATKDPLVPFTLREYQARYIAAIFGQKIPLPNLQLEERKKEEEVVADKQQQQQKRDLLSTKKYLGWDSVKYIDTLAKELSVPGFWENMYARKLWFCASLFFFFVYLIKALAPRKRRYQHIMVSNKP